MLRIGVLLLCALFGTSYLLSAFGTSFFGLVLIGLLLVTCVWLLDESTEG